MAYFSSFRRPIIGAGLFVLLGLPLLTHAQAPTITGLSPTRNQRNAARTANVAVTFSQPMQNAAATQQAVRVFSPQRGGLMFGTARGTASVSGNTITFNPTNDFQPGERVWVTTTTAARSSGGVNMALGHVHQFTAATGGTGGGNFGAPTLVAANPGLSKATAIGDFDNDGDLDLAIASATANSIAIRLNDGSGAFSGSHNVSVGTAPEDVITGDVDGDGDLDLVAANRFPTSAVSVRLNNGSGIFSAPATNADFSVPDQAYGLALGDIDADGDLDLAFACYNSGVIGIRRNDGTGNFVAPTDQYGLSLVNAVQFGDLNADGNLDLVGVSDGQQARVWLNTGTGSFVAPPTNATISIGRSAYALALGDLNADGDLDLVTFNGSSATASIRLNDGAGNLTAPVTNAEVSTSIDARYGALGDLDGDGDLDLVAGGGASSSRLVARLNDGNGVFSLPPGGGDFGLSNMARMALGDLDNDGDLDLAVAMNNFAGGANVLFNRPPAPTLTNLSPTSGPLGTNLTLTGTNLTGATTITFAGSSNNTVTAGFTINGAGTQITGVVVPAGATTGNVTVTTPNGTSAAGVSFSVAPTLAGFTPTSGPIGTSVTITGTGFHATAAQNVVFFGATRASVTAATATSLTVTVPLGATYQYLSVTNLATGLTAYSDRPFDVTLAGQVAFEPAADFTTGAGPRSVSASDVDGDGRPDLVVSNGGDNTVSVLRNTSTAGTVSFAAKVDFATGPNPFSVTVGDLDGDGRPDLIVANGSSNLVSVLRNTSTAGTISFAARQDIVVASAPRAVSVTDVDGDGQPDLAVACGSNTVSVLRNISTVGAISFAPKVDFTAGNTLLSVSAGDVDGDGKPDLAVSSFTDNTIVVLRNTSTPGTVSFAARVNFATGSSPRSVRMTDLDGDGRPDLTVANSNGTTLSVLRNTSTAGTVSFAAKVDFAAGISPLWVSVGDVDGDGRPDLVAAGGNGSNVNVSVLPSTSTPGTVSFAAKVDFAVSTDPTSVSIVDVDGDGKPDLAAAIFSGAVSVFRQSLVPTLTSLSPAGGPVGTSVTLTGTTLTGTTAVSFNGTAATTVNAVNATTVTATVPAGATTGNVTLTTGVGTSNALPFRVWYAPTTLSLSNTSVTENAGTAVGTFSATDPNSGDTFAYTLVSGAGSADNGDFTVSGNSLQLNAPADYETQSSYAIRVRVTDSDGLFLEQTFTVTVTDVAEPLVVSTVQTVPGGHYSTLTVTGTGIATLGGAVEVDDAVLVQTGGILADNCQALTGTGSFTLEAGATLRICNPDGIAAFGASGAIQLTGGRTFPTEATYAYVGAQPQTTGTGLPFTVRELVTANAAGVTLARRVSITDVLRLSSGVLNTNGQPLTLLSDATRTAYAVHAGGSTSGDVTVERYVGGPSADGYRHLSSPVQNTTVADLQTSGFMPQINAAYNALPYVAQPINQFPNVFGFDETRGGTAGAYAGFTVGYYSPTALTDVLTSGRGWTVYLPGGKTPDFVGELTTGNVARFLTATGANPSPNTRKAGWHLLGNPYPQPIDWDLATVPTGMDAAISVYRTSGGANGAYLTRANGIGSLPDGVLPVGQAFFGRVTAARTFTFTNALRVEANPGAVARTTTETRPVVTLTLGKHGATVGLGADATYVYFETGATAGFDGRFDGYKPGRNVGVPTLATMIGTDEAAINGLPETALQQGVVLPLLLDLPTAGIYELSAELLNLSGQQVVLADQLTGTRVDLSQLPTYAFRVQQSGVITGRFALEINVGRVTGLAVGATAPSLTLYPNPAHGTVRVAGASAVIHLLDATGRVVRAAPAGTEVLDLMGLPAGVYVLRSGLAAQRLVVE